MTDTMTFDAADAAHREIHVALGGTLTSTDVGALIDRASKHVAECDALAALKASAASDATLPTRDALVARQEADALTFVADRLRYLMPALDRRRTSEADAEQQAQRRDQYDQAQKRVDEISAKVTRDYPKAVATIMGLVAEMQKADAIAADANRNLPRDMQAVPAVETVVGAEIQSRLHLPALDGTMAHEMSAGAVDAFKAELWSRDQRAVSAAYSARDDREHARLVAREQAARDVAAEAHAGSESEKAAIRAGIPVLLRRSGVSAA